MAFLRDEILTGKPAQLVTSYIAHLPPNLKMLPDIVATARVRRRLRVVG
jgi:hypothetical protein